jgi:hypothetical protein
MLYYSVEELKNIFRNNIYMHMFVHIYVLQIYVSNAM